ncbi:MAG: hypothetical protein QG648_125 [Patescibacteria group bacterium]|nr:hypothetical protein [Patescibacteria group bacterium]
MSLQIFTPLELFVIAHFLGDFFLQNKWMSFYKDSSPLRRGVHSLVYALVFLPFMWYYHFSFIGIKFLILFGSHFLIDNEKMFTRFLARVRHMQKDEFNETVWRIILLVTDQLYHLLIVVLILMF